jgi:acetyltransferase
LRVTTIEETLTALRALERGVLPDGDRIAILTNAGGAGIIAADACVRAGLEVPPLSEGLRERLRGFLPPEAGLGNPVDMIATASSEHYERALDLLLEATDAAIVIFRPPLVFPEPVEAVGDGVLRVTARHCGKPVLVCTLGSGPTVEPLVMLLRGAGIPTYAMPETAVAALSILRRAVAIRGSDDESLAAASDDRVRAAEVLGRVRQAGRTGLFFDEGAEIIAAYGISVCPFAYVADAGEASRFLAEAGAPLVLKVDAPALAHRYERDAVIVGIETEDALREAVERLRAIIESSKLSDARLLAQKMIAGRELIFGLERDPAFGPAVMFGIGGTLVEALQDVAFGVAPISVAQAGRMVRSIRAFPLLDAFRGQPAVALSPLVRIVTALGRLGLDAPQIAEIDLNPVIADEHGAMAVDILIRLTEERG